MAYLEIGDVAPGSTAPVQMSVVDAGGDRSTVPPVAAAAAAGPPFGRSMSTTAVPVVTSGGAVPASLPSTAREVAVTAAVAAVYVERFVKKRRASTVIVSGLPIVNSASDHQQFVNLCQSEFQVQPDVVHIRRLGPSKPGRVQPLMVALRTEEAASHLLEQARRLRQSADDYVRSNIYLNANLTRAEANAAFQLRQRRREKK